MRDPNGKGESSDRGKRWTSEARVQIRRILHLVLPVLPAVVLLLAWELSGRYFLDTTILGQPSEIIRSVLSHAMHARIWYDTWITTSEILVGYGIGVLLGAVLGYCVGISVAMARMIEPYVLLLNAIPKVAVAPLFIVVFGIGLASKVAIVVSLVFFLMFYAVYVGLRTLDVEFIHQARIMGVSRAEEIRYIVLPAIMPNVLVGMKTSAASAVIGAIIGEIVASRAGLGFFILEAAGILNANDIWVGVAYLMLVLLVMTGIIGLLERYLLRWMPQRRIG
jgi:NitT/TauT family transport system permease protein